MLHELFKGKGDPGIPAAYRDVMMADDDGNHFLNSFGPLFFPLLPRWFRAPSLGRVFRVGSVRLLILLCNFSLTMLGNRTSPHPLFSWTSFRPSLV